jgi:hypothetical protein
VHVGWGGFVLWIGATYRIYDDVNVFIDYTRVAYLRKHSLDVFVSEYALLLWICVQYLVIIMYGLAFIGFWVQHGLLPVHQTRVPQVHL